MAEVPVKSLEQPKILFGGQAVIEGVMMRGRHFVACAVRRADGEIALKNESIPEGIYSGVWSKTPFLRALPLLWDTLVLGTRMLMWAANVQAAGEEQKGKGLERERREIGGNRERAAAREDASLLVESERALQNEAAIEASAGGAFGSIEGAAMFAEGAREERESAGAKDGRPFDCAQGKLATEDGGRIPEGERGGEREEKAGSREQEAGSGEPEEEGLPQAAIYGSLAVSLALGIGIFFALPVIVANFLGGLGVTPFWNNIAEGVIRLALFLGYLLIIGRIPEIQRVFMYHGAEHKTIAAFEGGANLVPAEVQRFSKEHPRCGTGFLLTVVVISIIFFVLLGDLSLGLRLASRILLIPLVAAVSYELIRFASQHRNIFIFDWLVVRPSLTLQSLTTREPTDDMIEVAVKAFETVRQKEIEYAH